MKSRKRLTFDPIIFLAKAGDGKTMTEYSRHQTIFAQGDSADAIFYLKKGKATLKVVSRQGKEAVIAILGPGDFFGEGCLAGQALRMASASTLSDCAVVRVEKEAAVRVLRQEPSFSGMFIAYLLSRNIRIEEDLVDQLFNSSEKRLVRFQGQLLHEQVPETWLHRLQRRAAGGV